MKKSNVIIFTVLALISIFLLWLWYYLGLNRIDEPLDLILSIIWWAMIIVAIIVIIRVEQSRRKRIRTVYVSDELVFNSEAGSLPYDDPVELVSIIEKILKNLKYDFSKNDLPNKNAFPIRFMVRTFDFDKNTWKGEVVGTEAEREAHFDSKEELFKIINGLQLYNPLERDLTSDAGGDS